eukprot:10945723-Heterocapsa_arctica.AAC.1
MRAHSTGSSTGLRRGITAQNHSTDSQRRPRTRVQEECFPTCEREWIGIQVYRRFAKRGSRRRAPSTAHSTGTRQGLTAQTPSTDDY